MTLTLSTADALYVRNSVLNLNERVFRVVPCLPGVVNRFTITGIFGRCPSDVCHRPTLKEVSDIIESHCCVEMNMLSARGGRLFPASWKPDVPSCPKQTFSLSQRIGPHTRRYSL